MLRELNNKKWPSGGSTDIATVIISNEEVERRTGMSLVSGVESGLGAWVGIGGKMSCGIDVEFIRYTEAPKEINKKFIVRVDMKTNYREALKAVLVLMQIDSSKLDWVIDEKVTQKQRR